MVIGILSKVDPMVRAATTSQLLVSKEIISAAEKPDGMAAA
jgi:hypothetical protein